MQRRKKRVYFIFNEDAALGLPMRLTVSLIIGTVALIAILSYILNPCLFPGRMIVSVNPIVTTISGSEPENVTFMIYVNTTDGHPISGASVLIRGLGGAEAGFTDHSGKVVLQIRVLLEAGTQEGYVDISVKAACREPFEHQNMVKIVKSNR